MRTNKRNKGLTNTGFDNSTGNTSGRIFNANGKPNVKISGITFFEKFSSYHTLIDISFRNFILLSLLAFMLANLIFALLYFIQGPESLAMSTSLSPFHFFLECYFFSIQTITTVGYGHYYPNSIISNILVSVETLFGWMSFAVLTGLLYARFSKPTSFLKFSRHALISPHKDDLALMFRLVPFKNTILSDASLMVTVSIVEEVDGKQVSRFFPLTLETPKIVSLLLNWTSVHVLNEESPLYQFTKQDLIDKRVEILVFFEAYDEHYSNIVKQRHSYTANEIIWGGKFDLMFNRSEDNQSTILQIDKLNDYQKVDIL